MLFSCFFAAFAVERHATAGGPTLAEIVDVRRVGFETTALLASSYTCLLSFAAALRRNLLWTQVFMAATALLGLVFVGLEAQEFADLVARGITPQRSAMLSSFFGLVGPWRACDARRPVARDHDGAGAGEGLPARNHPPADLLQSLLARARYRLDRRVHDCLPDGAPT